MRPNAFLYLRFTYFVVYLLTMAEQSTTESSAVADAAPDASLTSASDAAAVPLTQRLLAKVVGLASHPSAPLVVGGVVLAVAAVVAYRHFTPLSLGRPSIVVFDPVKFLNAQRAAASILAVSPSADLTLTMTQVAKQSEAVIKEEAHGAVVLVKQSVVVPDGLPDITDTVLKRFGLSTSVPTVTNRAADMTLESVAPTNSAFSSGKLREDYRVELEKRDDKLAADAAKQDAQTKIVP